MAASDKKRIADALTAMAEVFGKQASEAWFRGYCMGLEGLTAAQVESAVAKAMRGSKFMPTPSELRELSGELSTTDRPRLAWDEFERAVVSIGGYKSPDFADPLINATIRHLGGWQRCCELPAEEFDKWLRKDFEATYATFMRSPPGNEACGPLVGICEQHNRVHAADHPVPLVEVGTRLPPIPGIESRPRVSQATDVPRVEFRKP